MKPPVNILLLDDSPLDAQAIEHALRRWQMNFVLHYSRSGDEYIRQLNSSEPPDIILADYNIPDFDGMMAFKHARELAPGTPFIILSTAWDDARVVASLKNGAADFLLKDHLARLPAVIDRALAEKRHLNEKRAMTEHLTQTEERYQILFDSNPNPIWVFDIHSLKFLAVNDAAVRKYGYSRAEFDGLSILDIRPPQDVPVARDLLTRWPRPESEAIPSRHRNKDGSIFYVSISSHDMMFEGHEARIVVVTDLTERTRAEEALRESEQRYRTMVENASELIYTADLRGNFQYANPATLKTTGYSLAEVLRMNYLDLVVPQYRSMTRRFYFRQYLGRQSTSYIELPFFSRTGEVLWFGQNAALVMENNEVTGFHLIARDITHRVRTEEELAKSLSLLRAALDSTADGILVVDRDMKVEAYNQKFLELWRIPFKIVDRHDDHELLECVLKLIKEPEKFLKKVQHLYGRPEAVSFDLIGLVDGRMFERYSQPQYLTDRIVGRVWSFRDVTERHHAEERLRSSHQQLRALAARIHSIKEEESARIAREIHDELGQALTGLKMDLKWLEKHLPDTPPLHNRIASMTELITGTISVVRRIATELRPSVLDALGLVPALEWQAQEFQSRTGIACQVESPSPDLHFSSEQSIALFRILQEALTNVLRHSHASSVRIALSSHGESALLIIHDNGRGITDSEVADPHSLGLLGMRERIQPLDGTVQISGGPDQGTTVTVSLPLVS